MVEFLERGGGTQAKYIFPRYGQNSGPVAENGAGLPNIGRYPIIYDMDYGVPPHNAHSCTSR